MGTLDLMRGHLECITGRAGCAFEILSSATIHAVSKLQSPIVRCVIQWHCFPDFSKVVGSRDPYTSHRHTGCSSGLSICSFSAVLVLLSVHRALALPSPNLAFPAYRLCTCRGLPGQRVRGGLPLALRSVSMDVQHSNAHAAYLTERV